MVALIRRLALVAMIFLVLAPAASGQGFRGAYNDGLAAIDRRDWDDAVASLRSAIEERPEENARLPRMFFRRYTPYFYLGVALVEQGDCRSATAAFAESERQGVIAGFPDDVATLRRLTDECSRRSALVEARKAALAVIERAADASRVVAELAKTPELATVWEWRESSLAKRSAGADRMLADARDLLADGGAEPALESLEEARRLAYQAYWQLEAVRAEAGQHLTEIRQLVERQRGSLDAAVEEARGLIRRTAALAPYPPGLAGRRDRLQGLVRRAETAREGIPPEEIQRLEADLETAMRALESAATPPPRALREAAEALFAGDYARAVELLENASWRGSLTLGHAALLRAAAHWSLWRLSPEASEELREAAVADVAECRRRVPTLRPADAWYSPAFRAFFEEVAREDASGDAGL